MHKFTSNTLTCKCGRTFKSAAGLYGHMGFCEECVSKDEIAARIEKRKATVAAKKAKDPNYYIVWNKGLTAETDARVKKMRDSRKLGHYSSLGRSLDPEKEARRRMKLSNHAHDVGLGGYVPGSGKGRQGRYKGIWCDSSWELAYVIFNLDHNIDFERNSQSFPYKYRGQEHRYTPDFICDGQFIEIKGYERPIDKYKYVAIPDLKILYEADMKPYLEYVIHKYGSTFTDLYDY